MIVRVLPKGAAKGQNFKVVNTRSVDGCILDIGTEYPAEFRVVQSFCGGLDCEECVFYNDGNLWSILNSDVKFEVQNEE